MGENGALKGEKKDDDSAPNVLSLRSIGENKVDGEPNSARNPGVTKSSAARLSKS
jgi:hypothetical protein